MTTDQCADWETAVEWVVRRGAHAGRTQYVCRACALGRGGTLGLKVVPCRPRCLKVSKVCPGILLRLRTPISLKVTNAYALQMRVTDASLDP